MTNGSSRDQGRPTDFASAGEHDTLADQLRALVDAAEEYAVFRLDPDGVVVGWNHGAERITGYQSDDVIGDHYSTFYTEPDRLTGVPEANLDDAAALDATENEGWRVRADDSRFWATVTITAIRDSDGGLEGFVVVVRDATDRMRARQDHHLRLSVSRSVAEAPSLADGLEAAIEDVCEWTDWVVGQAWVPNEDGTLERLPISYVEREEFSPFVENSREFAFGPGEGIPGRVLESADSVWFPDVTAVSETVYPRTALASTVGLQAGLGVPVLNDGAVVVVLEFYMAEEREIDEHLVELVGTVTADLGNLVDRKQIEDEFRREQELLAEMMDAAPAGITVLTADGQVERMNATARSLRDVPPGEELADASARVFFDEDGDEIRSDRRPFALVRETGRPVFDWTGQIELPDGRRTWLSIDAAPIFSDDGDLDRVVIVEEDVTELRAQYRAITESINDVVVTIDTDSIVRSVNPAVEEVFGYTPEELLGVSLTKLMPDEYAARHQAALERYLETGERTLDWEYVELTGERTDGSRMPLGISFSEMQYDGDRFFNGVARDITERKTFEDRLARRSRQQRAVAELGQRALETDDLDVLMREASRVVATVLDTDYCKVLDLDEEAQELRLRQGVGWRDGVVGTAAVDANENSQAGYTLRSEAPVVVADLTTEERFSGPDLLSSHGVTSGISTIIGSTDEPWGILGTHDTSTRPFTELDVNFVQTVANVLAAAIDRETKERRLRERETQLQLASEAASIGLWTWDVRDDLVTVDSFVVDAAGMDPATVASGATVETFLESIHEVDRQDTRAQVERALETGELDTEYRVRSAEGELTWLVARGDVEYDERGEPVRMHGAVTDITERKRREQKLREREARYRELFTSMSEGYCVIERVDASPGEPVDFRYVEANPAFEELSGVEDVVGKTIRELVPGEGQEWFDLYDGVVETGEAVRYERELVAQERHLECYAFPVGDAASEQVGVIFTDVTERVARERRLKELIEKLEASNERLEQFAYAASHDLQEPLRMISSYLQLVDRRYGDSLDEDGREFLDFAVDGADRMRAMIEGLLEYARVDTEGASFESVDLETIVEEVSTDLSVQISETTAVVDFDDLPHVRGDERQLRQVFQNLIRNAIQYSGDGQPRIHVAGERRGERWTISVSDEGVGIEPAEQERIFELFKRLHSPDGGGGSGIGLALCERIVERHGGEIWVESTPGEGATFSFDLPAVDDDS